MPWVDKDMVSCKEGTDSHPDKIARMLASMNAATILAQRLDVPDSAAECLRALGSLTPTTCKSKRGAIPDDSIGCARLDLLSRSLVL